MQPVAGNFPGLHHRLRGSGAVGCGRCRLRECHRRCAEREAEAAREEQRGDRRRRAVVVLRPVRRRGWRCARAVAPVLDRDDPPHQSRQPEQQEQQRCYTPEKHHRPAALREHAQAQEQRRRRRPRAHLAIAERDPYQRRTGRERTGRRDGHAPPRNHRVPPDGVVRLDGDGLALRDDGGGIGELLQVGLPLPLRGQGEADGKIQRHTAHGQPHGQPPASARAQQQARQRGQEQQQADVPVRVAGQPLQSGFGERGPHQRGVAAARHQQPALVAGHCPLADDERHLCQQRCAQAHAAARRRRVAEAQRDRHRIIGVQPCGQRHERLRAVAARAHGLVVYRRVPELHTVRQREAERLAPARLHIKLHDRLHLPVPRDLARQPGKVHHLVHGLGRLIPRHIQLQPERPAGVLVGGERRRDTEQPELRRQFERFQLQQAFRRTGQFYLKRADHLHIAALALHADRAHLAGPERAARRRHRLLKRHQQCGRAEHGLRQRDDELGALAPLGSALHVLAGDLDLARPGRHFHPPLGGRRADDEVVDEHAAVDDPLVQRVEMKHVRLHALSAGLDTQRRGPGRVAQPPGLLQTRGLAWEISQRHLGELRHTRRRRHDAVTRCRHGADMAAHRLCARINQRRQRPVAGGRRLVFLQPQPQQDPPLRRLREQQLERAPSVNHLRFECVVGHAVAGHADDRIVGRNFQCPVAQRRLAHVELQVRVDHAVGLAQLVGHDLRHAHLRQNLPRRDLIRVARRRETVDKNLPCPGFGRSAGKLLGRELHQPFRVRHLEPHRAGVGHAHVARVAHRPFRRQPQRHGRHGEAAQRRLASHHELAFALEGPAQAHRQRACFLAGQHLPARDQRAFDGEDFARPVERQPHLGQLPLQDAE